MTRWHLTRLLISTVLLSGLIAVAAVQGCRPKPSFPEGGRPRPTGGVVNGSLYYVAPLTSDDVIKKTLFIFLPDIDVYLHNASTGVDSATVTTDRYGRYFFPHQSPGTYELRWKAQRGWPAGSHPDPIVVTSGPKFPVSATIRADSGVVFGRVTLADGGSPWSYDELFAINHTATVTILNAARTATLAGPVHTNVEGLYAVAGLPRGSPVSIRAQSEASTVTRAVPASSISFGNSVSRTDVQLANARPEIVSIFPQVGGVLVKTAAPGDTISLMTVTRDVNADPLTYQWMVTPGNGSLTPAGASANWKLPSLPGRHSAYLQVKDGKGGYARQRIDFVTNRTDATFSGRAVDKGTGASIAGATVVVNGKSTTTDGNGFFRVQTPLKDRYVMNIAPQGYALFSRVVDSDATGQTWRLVKAQSQTVDPTMPITIVDRRPELERKKLKGVRINVPANSLVGPTGMAPTGMLTAYVATLDTSDAEAPGDWGALLAGNETNLLSYGAAFVEFRDAGGAVYNLAPGKLADVEVFAPPKMLAGAPPNLKLWSYDETDGYWKQSGNSTFSAVNGSFAGQVRHFSTINTDLEKNNAACLKVLIYPPIPTGVKLRVTDPTGAVFSQAFEFVLDAGINAVYRLPANTDVRLELFNADGTAYADPVLLEEQPGVPLAANIVNTGPPIPPGSTLWPPEPYETCKLVILREAAEPTANAFLAFKGLGTDAQAQAYYNVVDPDENSDGKGERTTLGDWWAKNGFVFDSNGIPTNAVRTSYLNFNDLGSGRDMYFRQNPDGTAAAYVTNYGLFNQDAGNADLAESRNTPGATVCMEYGPVFGQGATRIVKFFVFAGNGGGANATRQTGADLDGFGVKFVPNLCLNCHGGNYNPANPAAPTFAETNMGASFRELDTATYKFPGFRLAPNATEKAAFHQQNTIVKGLNAGDTIAIQPIKDLITGWYAGGTDDQDNSYTPPGWVGAPQQNLYRDLIRHSCRTCHVAQDADTSNFGIGWITYDQLKQRHGLLQYFVLCDGRFMPHAVTTYRNFWLSASPHQPAVLRDFSNGAGWPALGVCQ
ncbi:MAG TPA: hypothetical protein VGS96_08230 [Thermoanaerobaculia bacterium]|nr:hypothetical protein [Thermoanaerobaculia bacterium]